VTRDELFADDDERRQIRFYVLRDKGITWCVLAKMPHLEIQFAAGHESSRDERLHSARGARRHRAAVRTPAQKLGSGRPGDETRRRLAAA
jgi:hypothetical protein